MKCCRNCQIVAALIAAACVCLGQANAAAPSVKRIEVLPKRIELNHLLDRVQLQVTGTTAAGKQVDLTRHAKFALGSSPAVSLSNSRVVAPLRAGATVILVRYGQHQVKVPAIVKLPASGSRASFRRDVIPVLTRAGCNQGACHGAQFGKGGLKLSLLGFAPEQDYTPLVRGENGRRVSLIRPEDSLILHKALMRVSHAGGRRFLRKSYDYAVLRAWLSAGAPGPQDDAKVVGLTVYPKERIYEVGQQQQLRVVARYSDNSLRDVTLTARYDSLAEGIASVSATGHVEAVGKGQAAIMVRYDGQATVSNVLSPFARNLVIRDFKTNNFIDQHVKSRWERLGIRPAGICSDAEFIRRAFLDSVGSLPTAERVQRFLASKDKKKRRELVDELLGLTGDPKRDIYVESWSAYWSLKWGDLLRNNRNKVGAGGMWALANWMRNALRQNKPVDQFVREIITAQGSMLKNGPANYYKIAKKPTDLAETTAQVFLGVRIQCAKCHHHPYEAYSQADYYGLAAFFTRVGTKRSGAFGVLGGDTVVKLNAGGSIRHPRTGKIVQPTPLAGKPIDSKQVRDLRRPLASWLTSPNNKLFARNIVNRIWAYYMGSGLVEPIDDLRATNPPSNPALLDALADHLVKSRFDLRKLMRVIMNSRVYQLKSTPRPENTADRRFYPHYNIKRLPAEVLLDAIDSACGTQERFTGVPLGTRAIELPDPNFSSYFLDTLGRPPREIACECERTSKSNLAQVLHIANGQVISRKLVDKKGRISTLLSQKLSDAQVIRRLYLVSFSRLPLKVEIDICQKVIARAPNRREGVEDVLWAILNSREFLFNH